jgi:hypothetical protein
VAACRRDPVEDALEHRFGTPRAQRGVGSDELDDRKAGDETSQLSQRFPWRTKVARLEFFRKLCGRHPGDTCQIQAGDYGVEEALVGWRVYLRGKDSCDAATFAQRVARNDHHDVLQVEARAFPAVHRHEFHLTLLRRATRLALAGFLRTLPP